MDKWIILPTVEGTVSEVLIRTKYIVHLSPCKYIKNELETDAGTWVYLGHNRGFKVPIPYELLLEELGFKPHTYTVIRGKL